MITINSKVHNVMGTKTVYMADLALDNSYPVGGYPFDPDKLFGIHAIDCPIIPPVSGYGFKYDATNKKILAYKSSLAVQQHCHSVLGSANTDAETVDSAALPTNGSLISSALAQSDVATALGVLIIAAQPDIARNVCIVVTNDTAGNLNLYVGGTSFLVTGTYKGAVQTEIITITNADGTKAVAHAPDYRYKYGVKPFSTITSIVQTNYAVNKMANALKISVGLGSKVALLNTLATPAAADIFHADIKGAAYDASALVNTTYGTVNMGALTDADDFTLEYNAVGYASNQEVANGTDLSAITSIPIMLIGA
jgi:hypothetical protein